MAKLGFNGESVTLKPVERNTLLIIDYFFKICSPLEFAPLRFDDYDTIPPR